MSEWIDITRTLSNGMIQWPGDHPFHWHRHIDIAGPGTANVSKISTCVHVGTHIDAPLHFIKDGLDVTEIPLDTLCGPALLVDLPEERDLEIADLENAGLAPGQRLLLRTVNRHLWDQDRFSPNYHAISTEAAVWLVDHDIPLVGIDYLSVDRYENDQQPVHYALLGNGIVIIEGLDLSHVQPGLYEMIALPLKIAGSEGSPARVIIRPYGRSSSKRRRQNH